MDCSEAKFPCFQSKPFPKVDIFSLKISGLGTTIDIVLLNGKLREGQQMVVAGTEGPIVTQIRSLLTPAKMQDLRVKVSMMKPHK